MAKPRHATHFGYLFMSIISKDSMSSEQTCLYLAGAFREHIDAILAQS